MSVIHSTNQPYYSSGLPLDPSELEDFEAFFASEEGYWDDDEVQQEGNSFLEEKIEKIKQEAIPELSPIREDFKSGDLIYGLFQPRDNFAKKLFGEDEFNRHVTQINENESKLVPPELNCIYIDCINNQFICNKSDSNSYAYNNELIPEREDAQAFKNWIDNHEQYNPNKFSDNEQIISRIGKGCKAGIEYTTNNGKNVFFVLDELNEELVINEGVEECWRNSITGKELRWIYRHKDNGNVKNSVKFIKDCKIVRAPWEANSELWKRYEEYRTTKQSKAS
jgi:hypothetical protein